MSNPLSSASLPRSKSTSVLIKCGGCGKIPYDCKCEEFKLGELFQPGTRVRLVRTLLGGEYFGNVPKGTEGTVRSGPRSHNIITVDFGGIDGAWGVGEDDIAVVAVP